MLKGNRLSVVTNTAGAAKCQMVKVLGVAGCCKSNELDVTTGAGNVAISVSGSWSGQKLGHILYLPWNPIPKLDKTFYKGNVCILSRRNFTPHAVSCSFCLENSVF
uniref:Uncharacterized protein n=1 Tax=Cacopsylla melanoneura TaxID=428564 RepID=A0A8D8ZAU6_9HEMI